LVHGVIFLAVPAAGWVVAGHPEITPPSNFHHFQDTTGWLEAPCPADH
jgi:hypothetical protein